MLTLFTVPKPFRDHIAVIQRNAIRSWTLLRPACEIILLGNDEGTAEAAGEFGLRHVPHVARNEYGTPLVNDLFEKAKHLANHELLCYVNADIILMSDFTRAVERVAHHKRQFLMVGQRWDVDLREPWDFHLPDWQSRLRAHVQKEGELHPKEGIDYFVFPRDVFGTIPPFAVGRPGWDNWMIYRARELSAAVVDASNVVMAVHQNHSYGRFGSKRGRAVSPETQRNRELMGKEYCTLKDVTHLLQPDGLHYAWLQQILYPLRRLSVLFPMLLLPVLAMHKLPALSRSVWSALGLSFDARKEKD